MINKENVIGQNIICSGAGIGEIIDVTALHEGGEEFYKVTFPKDKCINYFSVANNNNYRVLASKKMLQKAIDIFKDKIENITYSSTQDKINTQKDMLKEENIINLAKNLSIIRSDKVLHAQISKPYKDTLDSFTDEIAFVLNTSRAEAYAMLDLKAPAKKVKK